MNIPPKSMLVHFSRRPTHTDGDRTKTMQEALRGVNYVPGMDDYAKNPADRTVEVFMYYSKSRIIWVLGRDWCAYNGPNPYGFLPFDFAPCFTVISRFYAMGYCDVLEGPQRYIEALYNARLDELSLSINPPRVKKLGSTTTPMQDRWAPGMVSSVNSPKDDWVVQFPNNATANIMSDIEFITDSASNVTGANSFMQGVPRAGNVNRTATGVSSQTQAGSSRLYYIVKNIEDYLVIPMLYKMYKLIQFHSDVTDTLPALGQDSQQVQVGAKAFQAPIRFKMVAASQMLTRDKLMQVLPFLTQYYLNGSFLQQLHGAGKTVDFDEFQRALMDATGTGTQYKFIRDLTQQEQQQMNAPPPEAQMQQQQKQQELQTRKQIADDKNQNQIHLELIKKQPDPHEIEQKRQEMAMEADSQRQEMAHEMEKHRLEMATRQDEMRMKSQEAQQDMALKLLQGQNDLGMQQQEAQFAQQNQAQTLQHTEEAHRQGVQHQEEAHKAALAQGGEKHKSGLKQGQEKHKAGLKQKEASAQQQLELKALMAQEQMQAPGQQGSGAE